MAKAGILGEDDRVELLDGVIVTMAPIGSRHAAWVDRFAHWFVPRLNDRAIVRVQNPVRLDAGSEPEADIALVRPRADHYAHAHPEPGDVLLLIEVADATLSYDRDVKLRRYARAGIPEVWIADARRARLFACRDPEGERYRSIRIVQRGETIAPLAFPDLELRLDDVIP